MNTAAYYTQSFFLRQTMLKEYRLTSTLVQQIRDSPCVYASKLFTILVASATVEECVTLVYFRQTNRKKVEIK